MRACFKRMGVLVLLGTLVGAACSNTEGPTDVTPIEDPDGDKVPPPLPTGHKYEFLSWSDPVRIELGSAISKAGWQGTLVQDSQGTLYYGYFKWLNGTSLAAECDIAVYGGGPQESVAYEIHVAVKEPQADTWASPENVLPDGETVTSRFGLDMTLGPQGQPVMVFAGGGAGIFSCGSGDLVMATRSGTSWQSEILASDSSACCTGTGSSECAPEGDGACQTGTDVGAWASVVTSDTGQLAVAFVDYHFYATHDGMAERGLEFWAQGAGISGIRPWSGKGAYSDLAWLPAAAGLPYAGPVVAYTKFQGGGVFVARRTGQSGTAEVRWDEVPVWASGQVGERLSLAVAPDGTLGLAFHARTDGTSVINDLVYCSSSDGGGSWNFPCDPVDERLPHLGFNPSLTFDKDSNPAISYYYCGTTADCQARWDALRFAWRDENGRWWPMEAYSDKDASSGQYSQLVLDANDIPTIVFQDVTNGHAMAVHGRL